MGSGAEASGEGVGVATTGRESEVWQRTPPRPWHCLLSKATMALTTMALLTMALSIMTLLTMVLLTMALLTMALLTTGIPAALEPCAECAAVQ